MASGSGSGPGSGRYLYPQHVFDLVIERRSQELLDYLYSVPGACADVQCLLASFAAWALRAPRPGSSPPWPSEDSWVLYWANYARDHAKCKQYLKPNYREAVGDSRKTTIPGTFITSTLQKLYVPQIAGNPLGYHSDPEHRHAAIIDQSKSSSSSTPTAILPPHQAFYNAVLNFPTTLARTHASDFAPWGTNPTLELAFTKLSLGQPGSEQMGPQELMQNNSAMGLPSQRQARSVQLTPPRLMQNREDIKGKGPAPEVNKQKLLVHVAAVMADGTAGAAGLLIKKGTGRFLCASYFPMRVTQPVLLAAACCEGIKIAGAYQPGTIVVESHQFHLLTGADAPCLHKEELLKLLDSPRCTVGSITEECNSTACQLASRCLRDGLARIYFGTLPDFSVLT